jgi:hypothetical protein
MKRRCAAITIRQINNEKERKKEMQKKSAPNKNAQFRMCLGFMELRLESAEFVCKTTQGQSYAFSRIRSGDI